MTYDVQTSEKESVRKFLQSEWSLEPISDHLEVCLFFELPYPKSWTKKRKANYAKEFHMVKPDIDNLVKFYLDCMNGIIFEDDKQIVRLYSSKQYCDHEGSTYIQVEKPSV